MSILWFKNMCHKNDKVHYLLMFILFLGLGCLSSAGDFSTPEATMAFYIHSIQKGDLEGVEKSYESNNFNLPKPIPIKSFKILKKRVLKNSDVSKLNFLPAPQQGDVELEVMEIFTKGKGKYTYYLRFKNKRWKIYAHYSWSDDS